MATLLVLLAAGCQAPVDDARTLPAAGGGTQRIWTPQLLRDLPAIQNEGVLRIIAFPGPPGYLVLNGEETGFEYELAAMFAHEWNLRLEVVTPGPGEGPFTLLNEGRGDLVSGGYTASNELKRRGDLTRAYAHTREHLVLGPWADATASLADLDGLTVYVRAHSPQAELLRQARDRQGLNLRIVTARPRWSEEDLLDRVADGQIAATVATARSCAAARVVHPGLVLGPPLTGTVPQCWIVRRNSPDLRAALDRFLRRHYRPSPDGAKRSQAYGVLEDRYFDDPPQVRYYRQDELRPDRTGRLSPWDEVIREASADRGLDWILVASLIFEESRFDPDARSGAGAVGLMQLLPRFTAEDSAALHDPETNIRAGVDHLAEIHESYHYLAPEDRWYFTLATYHAGFGHMNDARRMAMDAELDPNKWHGNVEEGLKRKRDRIHYPQSRHGYYRGDMSVRYAESILYRHGVYRLFLDLWTPPPDETGDAPESLDYE
jgi:membrane-bound lytic murein transglycosylase F